MDGIKAKCKNCKNETEVMEMVLDPDFGMVVCRACVKAKNEQASSKSSEKDLKITIPSKADNKPAGWDDEDEYLERAHKHKPHKKTGVVSTIDQYRLLYRCPECKYQFTYNKKSATPKTCHYCDSEIIV